MQFERLADRKGQLGIVASLVVWGLSVPALGFAMRATQAGSYAGLYHAARSSDDVRTFHVLAVVWGTIFVVLQLAAPLLLTFTLRAFYRLRSAVCFTISVGCSLVLDALGMLSLLIWLRWRLGVG